MVQGHEAKQFCIRFPDNVNQRNGNEYFIECGKNKQLVQHCRGCFVRSGEFQRVQDNL